MQKLFWFLCYLPSTSFLFLFARGWLTPSYRNPSFTNFPPQGGWELDIEAKVMCNAEQRGRRKLTFPSNAVQRNSGVPGAPETSKTMLAFNLRIYKLLVFSSFLSFPPNWEFLESRHGICGPSNTQAFLEWMNDRLSYDVSHTPCSSLPLFSAPRTHSPWPWSFPVLPQIHQSP